MLRGTDGNRGERSSALWGTGNRGGDSRSNALWGTGKSGRGLLTSAVALIALCVPIIAVAASGKGKNPAPAASAYIAPELRKEAKASPDKKVDVIISSSQGFNAARDAFRG